MLRALLERGIQPDVIVGTSIGAINGAAIAARPDAEGVADLAELWREVTASGVFAGSVIRRVTTLARTRTALHSNAAFAPPAREAPARRPHRGPAGALRVRRREHRAAAEHWFARGPLVDAVLASAAVPGILPPVRIDDEHFIDGGIVNSIPVSRAVALEAEDDLRLPCGTHRPGADRAPPTLRGGPRRLRDRATAPLPRRHGEPPRRRRGARAAHR